MKITPSAILPSLLGLLLPVGISSAQTPGASPFGVRGSVETAPRHAPAQPGAKRAARSGVTRTPARRGRSGGALHSRGAGSAPRGHAPRVGAHGPGFGMRIGRRGVSVRFGEPFRRAPARCGYWENVRERFRVPAVYEWRYDSCGRPYRVCVKPACWEYRVRRVWRAGCHSGCNHSARRGSRRFGRRGRS